MSVNFRPLADRVLVEPVAAETKTASGIIIPDTAKEKPQEGIVVAVGEGKKYEPLTVKVGDVIVAEGRRDDSITVEVGNRVLYKKHSGIEVKLDGREYLIVKENDILGILG